MARSEKRGARFEKRGARLEKRGGKVRKKRWQGQKREVARQGWKKEFSKVKKKRLRSKKRDARLKKRGARMIFGCFFHHPNFVPSQASAVWPSSNILNLGKCAMVVDVAERSSLRCEHLRHGVYNIWSAME